MKNSEKIKKVSKRKDEIEQQIGKFRIAQTKDEEVILKTRTNADFVVESEDGEIKLVVDAYWR